MLCNAGTKVWSDWVGRKKSTVLVCNEHRLACESLLKKWGKLW